MEPQAHGQESGIPSASTENGIVKGQKIIIPQSEVATNPQQNNPQKTEKVPVAPLKITFKDSTIQHVVLDHETLYSVSKRFMVSIDDLKAINDLKSSKIKPGDTLLIPIKKEKIEPVKIRALDKLIPTNPVDTLLYFPVKKNYKVAIILPFNHEKSPGYCENGSDVATEVYKGAK